MKRANFIIGIILLMGLLLRIYLFVNETFIGTGADGIGYARLGKNLIEKGEYTFGEDYNSGILLPYGYPLLIGLTNLFVRDLFVAGKLVSLLASLATIFLFYLIGKEVVNQRAGLFAALAYALYPYILHTSVLVQTESIFFMFFSLAIYLFVLLFKEKKLSYIIFFGIAVAFSHLIRPEGLVLLTFPFLFLKFKDKKTLVKTSLILLIILILLVSPYVAFLKSQTGKYQLTGKGGINFLIGDKILGKNSEKNIYSLNKEKTQLASYELTLQYSFFDYILRDPRGLFERIVRNVLEEIRLLSYFLLPIMLPLFLSLFNKDLFRDKRKFALFLLPIIFFVMYPFFFISQRYMYGIVFLIIPLSSLGFANASYAISLLFRFYGIENNRISDFFIKYIRHIIIILFISPALLYAGHLTLYERDIPTEHINAGVFLKNLSSGYETLNVMSRKHWVSFYSDSRYTTLPYANSTDVIPFAGLHDVDYVIIDERLLNKWESYADLLRMDRSSKDVELVYEDNSTKLIRIFKLKR